MTATVDTGPAAWLYVGRTMHARLKPFRHAFKYRIASLLVDVDRLDDAAKQSRWFSVDRFNLFSFHRRDHGDRSGGSLRAWAEAAWAKAGVALDGGPVRLLTFPRLLGYAFKPVSVWFGHGPDGDLRGVIYEVNNTFGDTHAYAAPAADEGALRQEAEKTFHVSPFFGVAGRYRFRLSPPDDAMALGIEYSVDGAPTFVATHTAKRRALTSGHLWRVFFTQPLLTWKIIAGIHWEALWLWRKGARYHARPKPPAPVSVARLIGSSAGPRLAPPAVSTES